MIIKRFPSLVGYSLTPARHWFTQTGLRKALFGMGINKCWDIYDIITKHEIPPKFRFVSWLLPLIKKLPYPYIRDIAHFPCQCVILVCQKD